MSFSLHRPSFIKNEPLLNALTSKGRDEADAALAARPQATTDRGAAAGWIPISYLRTYRDRVAALKNASATMAHSAVQAQAGTALNESSAVASRLVTAGMVAGGFNIPKTSLLHKLPNQKPPLLCSIQVKASTFRTTDDLGSMDGCDLTGLGEMNMSGSHQFDEKELDELFEKVRPKKLVVLDYTQEFHAFIDGTPIVWFAADNNNWANVEKKAEDILIKERKKLRKLPTKGNSLRLPNRDDVKKGTAEPRVFEVLDLEKAKLETEQDMVERKEGVYQRFPTADHSRFTDEIVDMLVDFLRKLHREERETGIVYHRHHHCYGGMGRTTLGMDVDDMLRNANKVECRRIIERQEKLRKRMQKAAVGENTYKQKLRDEKDEFLPVFHQYAQENPLDKEDAIPWTEWLKQKAAAGSAASA